MRRSAPLPGIAFRRGLSFPLGRTTYPQHRHPDIEIMHHPVGAGTSRTADGTVHVFAAGDTLLYPPFLLHDRTMRTAGTCCSLRLAMPDPLPATLLRSSLVRGPLPPWLGRELVELAGPQAVSGPADQEVLDHRGAAVLLALLGHVASAQQTDLDPDAGFAEQAATWIAERFAGIGRLEQVAEALGIPYDRLRRAFRRHRGLSMVAWLTAVRLARAKSLLADSALPHEEIARQCGYGSARYLNQVFRTATGSAPGAWRRRQGRRPARP